MGRHPHEILRGSVARASCGLRAAPALALALLQLAAGCGAGAGASATQGVTSENAETGGCQGSDGCAVLDAEDVALARGAELADEWRRYSSDYAPFYAASHPRYEADPVAPELPPVPGQPSATGWVWIGSHMHTSPGGEHPSAAGVKHIMEDGDAKGFDYQLLTDHNSIGAWFMKEFAPLRHAVPLRGEEWTSSLGHATLFDFAATDPTGAAIPKLNL